uniref:Uncharacterized protein n=1 Tax=Hucho hucho TaxID=62062 RepID=A0A4W5PRU3_9TELE
MSGSISLLPEMGAALFNIPTSSSNSDANTEEGKLKDTMATLLTVAIKSEAHSTGRAVSLRCCR